MGHEPKLCLFLYWMQGLGRDEVFERVRAADDAGAHSIWVSEGPGRDVFATMTQLAERTSRVRIGSSIVNVFSRSPAALAQHFATLDEISNGRMLIGLGAGRPQVIEGFHGIPFERPLRRIRECAEILALLVSGRPAAYRGEIFQLRHDRPLDCERVRSHIPIYIGALSPASIRQTAEIADGWLPAWTPLEALGGFVRAFREQVAGAGRDPAAVTIRSPGTTLVTNDVHGARESVARTFATYIAGKGDVYHRHLSRLGYSAQVERIREAWGSGGPKAAGEAVPAALQQSVGFVTCDVGEARERLAREAEAGIDLHSVEVQAESRRDVQRTLEALRA